MSRTYLILGASSDVGIALIQHLNQAESEIRILAHYYSSKDALEKISIRPENTINFLQCDLSNPLCLSAMIEQIKEIAVPDSIIHLSAPKITFTKFKNLDWKDCLEDLQVQVGSIYQLLQDLLPQMIKGEQKAKIIFLLSENTIMLPAKFTMKYSMSKYMLLGFMKSLTAEYLGKNVNINAISPTLLNTKLWDNVDRRMLEAVGATDKMLQPEEVVSPLLYLLSSESDELYGKNIYLSGEQKWKIE